MNKRHNDYFAVIAAMILAALLASGCSTPAQTGNMYEGETSTLNWDYGSGSTSSGSTSQSYYQCMNVLTQYGMQQQCYQVSSPYANSYSQYTYSKVGFAKGISEEAKVKAYADYLASLDAQTSAEMKAQYDALISQYTK